MNDIEYMLRQDTREKKSAGRGVYHKRSGSKTRYVRLPSDHMTKAEWKRRNGPMETYNISRVITTLEEFKRLPLDLAQQYITTLQTTYNVSPAQIAETLHCHGGTLTKYCKTIGISYKEKRGPHKVDPAWELFCLGLATTSGAVDEIKPAPVIEEPVIPEPATPVSIPEPVTPVPIPEPETPKARALPTMLMFEASGTPEQLLDMIVATFADMTDSAETYSLNICLDMKER